MHREQSQLGLPCGRQRYYPPVYQPHYSACTGSMGISGDKLEDYQSHRPSILDPIPTDRNVSVLPKANKYGERTGNQLFGEERR